MMDQDIRDLIRQMEDLPTLPSVAVKIISTLLDETSTAQNVAEIVEADHSLTAKVLVVANSAFFGVPRGVSTVKQAIVSLGFSRLKSIILSLSVMDTVDEMVEGSGLDPEEVQRHSLISAVCAEDLAAKLDAEFADEIFVAGLLHDIGKLVLARHAPGVFQQAVEMSERIGISAVEAERSVMDMDHAQTGKYLMDQWQFPVRLKAAVGMHHDPPLEEIEGNETKRMAAVICLADILANARNVGGDRGRDQELGVVLRQKLGLSETDIEEVMSGLDDRLRGIAEALGLEEIPQESYSEILQKANAELGRMSLLLRESEERYRGIFESIQDVYVEALWEDGRILEISPSIEQVGGYRREQMLNKSLFALFADPDTHTAILRAVAENGSVGDYEATFITNEGAEVPCSLSLEVVVDRDGMPWKLLGTMRDITERKDAEERLRLQDRLAAVGQLAAGIAHDFNNLLTGIIGYAQLLQRRSDIPEPSRKNLGVIARQGERAAHLIRQILDFSRKSVIQRDALDLKSFLKEACTFLERTIPEHIQIDLNMDAEEYAVCADPTQIQQMLTNLVVNARDAMPEGGMLQIRLSRFTLMDGIHPPLPEMGPGEWVALSVSDTGTGIDAAHLSHIYEPFFTTKEVGEGTGLGLAQVYGIVMQHEGFINVKSQLGTGTSFIIYLPALRGEKERLDEQVPEELRCGQGEVILLVEDEPVVLEALREMLEQLEYRVLTAGSGKEALDTYDAHGDEIALVLADIVMPEMGGVELLRALRAKSSDVRVAMMTGYPLRREADDLQAEGIVGLGQKPMDLARLVRLLEGALHAPGPIAEPGPISVHAQPFSGVEQVASLSAAG